MHSSFLSKSKWSDYNDYSSNQPPNCRPYSFEINYNLFKDKIPIKKESIAAINLHLLPSFRKKSTPLKHR